jgi:hypothetical protein
MLSSFAVHTYETIDDVKKALSAGTITATAELSGEDADGISSQYMRKESSINWGTYLFFNTSSSSIKNRDLRQAIRTGIDMDKIRGAAPETIAIDFPIIPSQLQLNTYPKLPERNEDESKNVIASLSADGAIKLNIATVKTGYLPQVSNTLADELRNGVPRTFGGLHEVPVGVGGNFHGGGGISDVSVEDGTAVDLDDVADLEAGLVVGSGGVMCSDLVDAEVAGECNTASVVADVSLDLLCDIE